jgi:GDP-4-dehydro-6-deoxy-D-mannose reductase
MKYWITGGGGFMGPHMADFLIENEHEVLSTYFPASEKNKKINPKARYVECDIRNKQLVYHLLNEFRPDRIIHLAAQSFPTVSWEDPWYTIETNTLGTINLFEGVKELGIDCKIMNACSSAAYGFVTQEEVPIKENHSLKPLHPYGVTKAAQEMLAYQYFKNFGVKSVSIRIFNTTGPGKTNDVCADFTKRIVEMEKGINKENKLKVGNLEAKRAITDVRDTIRAFYLALEKATVGESYNVSGEVVYRMGDIVEMIRKLTPVQFETEVDPKLIRPTDEPIIFGNSTKFKKETDWKQEIFLEKTLKDMISYWRANL